MNELDYRQVLFNIGSKPPLCSLIACVILVYLKKLDLLLGLFDSDEPVNHLSGVIAPSWSPAAPLVAMSSGLGLAVFGSATGRVRSPDSRFAQLLTPATFSTLNLFQEINSCHVCQSRWILRFDKSSLDGRALRNCSLSLFPQTTLWGSY